MKMKGSPGRVCTFYNYHEPTKTCELNFKLPKHSSANQADKGDWETYILKSRSTDPVPYDTFSVGCGEKVRTFAIQNRIWRKILII